MITVQNIIDWSFPHPLGRGMRRLVIGNDVVEFSIIGGDGLYGNFRNTFEVAIFDVKTGEYITNFFFNDDVDVATYVPGDELVVLINRLNRRNDFQVR